VDRARFEAHIADCEYCETYLEQMRQTIRTLGRIPEESLSDDARETLLEAFRTWRRA
jgi:anti-sigma factor RsiW